MTASEKLQQLVENDKLTDEQRDNLNDWGILKVSALEDYLTDKIKELKNGVYRDDYENAIIALYDLLDYDDDDEYVVYDGDEAQELDFDTLKGALDVD